MPFGDMTSGKTFYEIFNGDLIESRSNLFDSSNRAFRYGDGIFETICIRNKNPLFLPDHWSRIINSLKVLDIPLPGNFSLDSLKHFINELVTKNDQEHCRVRLVIYRVADGLYAPVHSQSAWHLSVTGSIEATYNITPAGLTADVFDSDYKSRGFLSNLKTLNALLYITAGNEASRKGTDDLFIKNDKGNIIESTNSNLFLRKEKTFTTPPLTEGCLDGVMRKQVIRLLQENKFTVTENPVTLDDVINADEIILTNVIRGAASVVNFKGKQYENVFSGVVNGWLNERFGYAHRDKR